MRRRHRRITQADFYAARDACLRDIANDVRSKPYHLIWHFDDAMRGQRFATWAECEAFSKRLIAAGLTPKLTAESPCPYDGLATDVTEITVRV